MDVVLEGVRSHLAVDSTRVAGVSADLAHPGAPQAVLDAAVAEFRHVDTLVCNHARSGDDGPLGRFDAGMLDRHWVVDAGPASCWPSGSPPSTTGGPAAA